jgi:hypothetical protein
VQNVQFFLKVKLDERKVENKQEFSYSVGVLSVLAHVAFDTCDFINVHYEYDMLHVYVKPGGRETFAECQVANGMI